MDKAEYLEFPDKPEPSCINCGFLGGSPKSAGILWFVADRKERTSGDFSRHNFMSPDCWRGAANLEREIEAVTSAPPSPQDVGWIVLKVIESERADCRRFQPWTPNWTVAEHLEEHKMHLIEKQRQEWEMTQEKARRKYESDWRRQYLPLIGVILLGIVTIFFGYRGSQLEANATLKASQANQATVTISPESGSPSGPP